MREVCVRNRERESEGEILDTEGEPRKWRELQDNRRREVFAPPLCKEKMEEKCQDKWKER